MKWFQHECTARHDPQIRRLGKKTGGEGLWIFFGLLEAMGQHSETVHLKILDLARDSDRAFEKLLHDPGGPHSDLFDPSLDLKTIPALPLDILAEDLMTTPAKLRSAITAAVALNLFDCEKWLKYNVLYNCGFARRADNYHRRQRRRRESVRTVSEQCADRLRSASDNVLPEQNTTEQDTTEEKKEKKQTRAFAVHTIRTGYPHRELDLPGNTCHPDEYDLYRKAFLRILTSWNETAETPVSWVPSDGELERLFLGGDPQHKHNLCLEASRVSGKDIHYADLVLRALRDLLKATRSGVISNPFGWLWSCLHGNSDGTAPWIENLGTISRAPP